MMSPLLPQAVRNALRLLCHGHHCCPVATLEELEVQSSLAIAALQAKLPAELQAKLPAALQAKLPAELRLSPTHYLHLVIPAVSGEVKSTRGPSEQGLG